jgi:hypothetical protein
LRIRAFFDHDLFCFRFFAGLRLSPRPAFFLPSITVGLFEAARAAAVVRPRFFADCVAPILVGDPRLTGYAVSHTTQKRAADWAAAWVAVHEIG